jgi:hypothetical protein
VNELYRSQRPPSDARATVGDLEVQAGAPDPGPSP